MKKIVLSLFFVTCLVFVPPVYATSNTDREHCIHIFRNKICFPLPSKPTPTPKSSHSPKPTYTPKPTHTPKPTRSPSPTSTPTLVPTPTPTPNLCSAGQEVTFANWYVPVTGVTTVVFDASCYSQFEFYWSCDSDMKLEYSNDQSTWTSQLEISNAECLASGMRGLDVIGKYYRVVVGPTNLPQLFVFAQGRYH
jgi:hypothetical protein